MKTHNLATVLITPTQIRLRTAGRVTTTYPTSYSTTYTYTVRRPTITIATS